MQATQPAREGRIDSLGPETVECSVVLAEPNGGRLTRNQVLRRMGWLSVAFAVWGAAITRKLVSLHVFQREKYLKIAKRQQENVVLVLAPRGGIFDRMGQPLALSVPMQSVYVNPLKLPDVEMACDVFSRLLKLDRTKLHSRIEWARQHKHGYLVVKRKISSEETTSLKSIPVNWIRFDNQSQRHYPGGMVASHLLGGVDREERGNGGIEQGLNKELRGEPGEARVLSDVKGYGIEFRVNKQPRSGGSIVLSIDERIQYAAEKDLQAAVTDPHAPCWTGTVVVMNPHTGEIFALASYPNYDPNQPLLKEDEAKLQQARLDRRNLAVTAPFEPGSLFKVITLSAALETTRLRPEDSVNCHNGAWAPFGHTIKEAKHGFGILTMAQVLEKSSNLGAIEIGLKVGTPNMQEYVRRFGFGRRTGLPLPGESPGVVRKKWDPGSIASVSMGHEICATAIQLAQACCIIANGGKLVRPRLVLKKNDVAIPPAPPVQVLRPQTALTMQQMMEGVVLRGTGKGAKLTGYSSAGKTGTAQIFDPKTKHYSHYYNASFMGFAPVTKPAIVVVVTLNGAPPGRYGGAVAAPVFKTVAAEALRVLDVQRDLPDASASDEELEDLDEAPQMDPPAGLLALADEEIEQGDGPRVPNYIGMSMRAVVEQSAAAGLPVVLDGSGKVLDQIPAPGRILHPGEQIRVQFDR